ncbi:zinc finger protein 883 isoform X1 [Anopheles aquasalis]|uniref:zinc finger protein 883 isoform X1 n=1 Tax=Anopheles aquasalis TaxID=42839 RepID=UPI00215B524F|nr:zinc finger protein 883 isoform X1 [Anopheles aquasalis]XP_050083789.1 zinc finger protein 883 isoform X1 [Anopheles aquasalis]
MMPNFYDGSRPTMVPTSSSLPVLLGNNHNQGDANSKKQLVQFDLEATLQTIDNEVLDGEEGSCPLCNKTFSRKTSLLNHIRNHSAEKKYVCEFCQKGFTQQANLRNHVRIHTNERPYVCVDCGKAFTQITNLNNHRRLHTGERPYVCIESNCGRSFAQVTNLNNHMKTHHKTTLYVCNQCPRKFSQVTQLNLHLITNHSSTRGFFCPQCPDKSFKQQSHLQQHMKIHGTNFGYSCSKCEEKFIQESHLVLHMKQHGDYACTMCSMTFNDEVLMKKHVQRHIDGRFLTCPVISCGEGFTMKNHLTKHMQMHHPAVDLKKLAGQPGANKAPKHFCHYHDCNESFDTADGLSNHLRIAHGLPVGLPLPDDKKLIQHSLTALNGIEQPGAMLSSQLHSASAVMNASFQSYQHQINQANQQLQQTNGGGGSTENKHKVLSVSDMLSINEQMNQQQQMHQQQHLHQQQQHHLQQRDTEMDHKTDIDQSIEDKMNNFNRIKTELQANMLAQTQNLFGLTSTLNTFTATQPKLICTYCYNVFKTPQTLSRHIEKFHS